jgi:MFS family permease
LRAADPTVTMESTYIVFPITITMGAIFMQLGAYMIEKVHPRIQMLIGGLCIVVPLFICSYTQNYYLFIFLYAVVLGLGFGLLYMVSLRNAW